MTFSPPLDKYLDFVCGAKIAWGECGWCRKKFYFDDLGPWLGDPPRPGSPCDCRVEERMNMKLNDLVTQCHDYAKRQGFWDYPDTSDVTLGLAKMALVHTEVSEACEALRRGDEENLEEELADILIRVFDFAGSRCIDMERAIALKMEKNEKREHMHGKLA